MPGLRMSRTMHTSASAISSAAAMSSHVISEGFT
jgi:hypothetical protein